MNGDINMQKSTLLFSMFLLVCLIPGQSQAQSDQERIFAKFSEVNKGINKAGDDLTAYRLASEAYADPALIELHPLIMQSLATQQSILGAYREAESLWYSHAGTGNAKLPDGLHAQSARDAIVAMSKGRRVVMLNEAHTIARTRVLTIALLKPLREAGFTHLALETLDEPGDAIGKRGYPVRDSGYYSNESIFGEMIRQALALGFVLLPYEYLGKDDSQQARETGQAENLAAILQAQPNARLLVHAGFSHIDKDSRGTPSGARSMAAELHRLTGIVPLSVQQTLFWDQPDPSKNHPLYAQAVSLWQAQHAGTSPTEPFVVIRRDGRAWSRYPASHDISVFSAPWTDDQHWRELGGLRSHLTLASNPCTTYPCLVEARYASESANAVPADRQFITSPGRINLWLRHGCYQITALPGNTQARGEVPTVCFHSTRDSASVQWTP